MKLRFTEHAKQRMAERQISERIVLHAIACGDPSIEIEAEGESVVRYALQLNSANPAFKGGVLVVIVDGDAVVTTYVRVFKRS